MSGPLRTSAQQAAADLRLARLALSTHDSLLAAGSAAADAPGQILFVSSARAGEGKTFVAQSLAHQWVDQHRDDVLLLSVRLASAAAPGALPRGLGEWLITAELPGTAAHAANAAGVLPACHGLTAPGGVVAASLFQLAAIEAGLARLRPHYATIIVDGPPLADAGVLPRLADTTLLVVDANRTPAHAVQSALTEARIPDGRLAGVVLNRQPRGLPRWLGG